MKLTSFKIKNFKSIIDTDWCYLSIDNITGLIGQNESGKSSILEALNCFFLGDMNADFLRNDDSFPEISCVFTLSEDELTEYFKEFPISESLKKHFKESKWRIGIRQTWLNLEEFKETLIDDSLKLILEKENEKIKKSQNTSNQTDNIEEEEETTEGNNEELPKILSEETIIKILSSHLPDVHFFEDYSSLLPNTIDLEDIINKKTKTEGYQGVLNFLTVAGIEIEKLTDRSYGSAKIKKYINEVNKTVTTNFQKFWSQEIGKNNKISIEFELKNYNDSEPNKAGKPYLEFWVQDGEENLHPKQRSKGVRWFLSFYLQLEADAKKGKNTSSIYLIDEPGASLHAKAQEDVLRVFEELKDKIQIIYTTHSPYLIKLESLYRLLAIQRSLEDDEKSETKVINVHNLGAASTNTLAPVLSCMGIDFSHQNVIQKKNNVLLEEISAFYYLSAFKKLFSFTYQVNFLPATGVSNIPQLSYLLLGWGIQFIVVVDDDTNGRGIYNQLKKELFMDDESLAKDKLLKIKGCNGIEDLFTPEDFKKYILKDDKVNVSNIQNSEYIKKQKISKALVAAQFMIEVEENKITKKDLNKETITKIEAILTAINSMLQKAEPIKIDPILSSSTISSS